MSKKFNESKANGRKRKSHNCILYKIAENQWASEKINLKSAMGEEKNKDINDNRLFVKNYTSQNTMA